MKVVVSEGAFEALAAIEAFVARDNPAAASSLVARLLARLRALELHPAMGRVVPELEDLALRELIERGHRIVYRARDERVEVLTVFEGHRLLESDELGGG